MSEDLQKIIFMNNLNTYIETSGKTQAEIAKAIGVSPQTFNTWCKGIAIPRMGKVQALADYFLINKSDLIEEKKISHSTIASRTINVLGRVAAGIPINAVEEIIDTEEITEDMAKTGEFFGLRISGHSMEPRICDGDVVIVRQQNNAETGDVVIVTINGDEATCKRLKKYRDGIELIANNPSYDTLFFDNEEIQAKPVRIIGKVVELRGKF